MSNETAIIGSIPSSSTSIREESTTKSTSFTRLKNIYFGKDTTMEKHLSIKSVKMSFIVGVITGGFLGHENAKRNFTTYAEGRSFGNLRNAIVNTYNLNI